MINQSQNFRPKILSINISEGGIPKRPTQSVYVHQGGLKGDGHHHEKHYRPIQAVSLQDAEKLEELKREGYSLCPGATGENITVSGLNVNNLPLGTRLEFSGGVVLEISKIRTPCYVLDAIHPKLKTDIQNRCGMYAKVLIEGSIHTEETIKVSRSSPQ